MRVRAGKSRARKRLENALSVGALRLFRALACSLPHRPAMGLAGRLGGMCFRIMPWWRRVAVEQLARAFPEWSEAEVRRCARSVFANFVKTAFEFFRSRQVPDEKLRELVRLEGMDCLQEGLARGKGVILLAAHYDNWEWLGRRIAIDAGVPFSVIARSQDDERLTRFIDETRIAGGLRVVDRDDVRGALRALRRGEILGIVPDQNVVTGGVFVEFFGRPAATVQGPVRLAARTGAAIYHCLSYRRADETHDGCIFPVAGAPAVGETEEEVGAYTQAWTRGLERWIRDVPDQWLWFHRRWKTQPAPEPVEAPVAAGDEEAAE